MPKWLKILLLLAAVGAVLLCFAGIALDRFIQKKTTAMEVAGDHGATFGASRSKDACVDEVAKRGADCSSVDPTCIVEVASFAWGCLEASAADTKFCDGVPRSGDAKAEAWAKKECAERGHGDDDQCAFALMTVISYCYNQPSK